VSDKKKRLEELRKKHPDLNIPDEDVRREPGQPSFNEALKHVALSKKSVLMKFTLSPAKAKSSTEFFEPHHTTLTVGFPNGSYIDQPRIRLYQIDGVGNSNSTVILGGQEGREIPRKKGASGFYLKYEMETGTEPITVALHLS
jgi:hypothetical protein